MPVLIRSLEQVLRETERDLYFICFHEWDPMGGSRQTIPAKNEVLAWFEEHLPQVGLEDLGPSEFSGYIEGGIGNHLRTDFDEESLKYFVSVWENPDGSYKDGRWTCYIYPYLDYLRKLEEDPSILSDGDW